MTKKTSKRTAPAAEPAESISPFEYGTDEPMRVIPSEAFKLAGDEQSLQFADDNPEPNEMGSVTMPISMLARSSQPIHHWYWGQIVHDMSGFSPDHPRIPADFCHWSDELVGYLDKFEVTKKGLVCSGELISVDKDDRASMVMKQGTAGIPYQASIFFRPDVIEEVQAGATAEVNGFKLNGPGVIIRQWGLRGVAVCPYGADHRTQSKFTDGEQLAVRFTVTKEDAMTKSLKATEASDAKPTETQLADAAPQTQPTNERATVVSELKKFTARFGAENGATWFAEGISYGDAMEKFCDLQAEQLTARDKQIEELQGQLSGVKSAADELRGEDKPLETVDKKKEPTKKFSHLGENRAKIAGAIKLPA